MRIMRLWMAVIFVWACFAVQAQDFTGTTDEDMLNINNWDVGTFTNTADPDGLGNWMGFDTQTDIPGSSGSATLQDGKFAVNNASGFRLGTAGANPTTVTLTEQAGETTKFWSNGSFLLGTASYSGDASLVIDGGEFKIDSSEHSNIGNAVPGNYLVQLNEGSLIFTGDGRFFLYPRNDGFSRMEVNGGTLDVDTDFESRPREANTSVELKITSGTVDIDGGYAEIRNNSFDGDTTLTMEGGALNLETIGYAYSDTGGFRAIDGTNWSGGTITLNTPVGLGSAQARMGQVSVTAGTTKTLVIEGGYVNYVDSRQSYFDFQDMLRIENRHASLPFNFHEGSTATGPGGFDLVDGLFDMWDPYGAGEFVVRNGATLRFRYSDRFQGTPTNLHVDAGGLVSMIGSSWAQQVGGLTGEGEVSVAGQIWVGEEGVDSQFDGAITGPGRLYVSPDAGNPAVFTLGGNSTYSDITVILENGTMRLGADGAFSPNTGGIYIQDGSVLDLNGHNDTGTHPIVMQYNNSAVYNNAAGTAASTDRELSLDTNRDTFYLGGPGDLTLDGPVTGGRATSRLKKQGAGKTTLNGGFTASAALDVLDGEMELATDAGFSVDSSYVGRSVSGNPVLTVDNDVTTTFSMLVAEPASDGEVGQAEMNVRSGNVAVLNHILGNANAADPTTASFTLNMSGGMLDIGLSLADRKDYTGTTHLNMAGGALKAEAIGKLFATNDYGPLQSIDWTSGTITLAGPAAGGGSALSAEDLQVGAGGAKTLVIDPVTSGTIRTSPFKLDDALAIRNQSAVDSFLVLLGGTTTGTAGLELLEGRTQFNSPYEAGPITVRSGAELWTGNSSIFDTTPVDVQLDAGGRFEMRNNQNQFVAALTGEGGVAIGTDSNLYAALFGTTCRFDGDITGDGGLRVGFNAASTGSLTLSGNNDYTGLTVVSPDSRLTLASDSALGAGLAFIQDRAVLDLFGGTFASAPNLNLQYQRATLANTSSTLSTYGGSVLVNRNITNVDCQGDMVLTGAIAFNDSSFVMQKQGDGKLTLAGGGDAGRIQVQQGILELSSDFSPTTIQVDAAGTLLGDDAVGTLTVSGVHKPGTSTGIQNVETATYNAGGVLEIEITANGEGTAGTDYDQLVISGDMTVSSAAEVEVILNSPGSAVDFTDNFWRNDHEWTIADVAGTLAGQFAESATASVDSLGQATSMVRGGFTTTVEGDDIILKWNAALPAHVNSGAWSVYE